jgi:prevent-host-death family protein
MTRKLTATEVKARILGLLDEVAAGDEIEITKHGRTLARLVPARGPRTLEGLFAGRVSTAVDDEEELFATGERWNAQ